MPETVAGLFNLVIQMLARNPEMPKFMTHDLVFRMRMHGDHVQIAGFRPTAAGTEVDAREAFLVHETLWLGYPRQIFADFNSATDVEDVLQPLHKRFRESKYDVFHYNPGDPEFVLTIKPELIEQAIG